MYIIKAIANLIENGELITCPEYEQDNSGKIYRLFTRNDTENEKGRSKIETFQLAEKIAKWCALQDATVKIDNNIYEVWHKNEKNVWISLSYIKMFIDNPVFKELEKIKAKKILDVIEKPVIKLSSGDIFANLSKQDKEQKKIGYFRADYNKQWYYVWFLDNDSLKTPKRKEEIDFVGTEIIYRMFPNGIEDIKTLCKNEGAVAINEYTYTMYYKGSVCDFEIQFMTVPRNYNIYVYCYVK